MEIPSSTPNPNPNKRIHQSNLEVYKARLLGKLCIAIVNIMQIISGLIIIFERPILDSRSYWLTITAIPLRSAMILLILFEYILFKKTGLKAAKYANLVDVILLMIFTAEWSIVLIGAFYTVQGTNPPSFDVSTLYLFTGCSWRTILVTLIVQNWKVKAIPPVVSMIITPIYVIYYVPGETILIIVRSAIQLFCMVLILFCEDKIKWRLIWSALHKEKWMQVNNFILNNIPENIMILDFRGDSKFISDSCKSFMKKYNISQQNPKELFNNIQDLQQLQTEPELHHKSSSEGIQIEKLMTQNELLQEINNESPPLRIQTLGDLLINFRRIIEEEHFEERQFLIYNGKLKMENSPLEKSIEIKISFIKNFNNEYIILILRDMTQRDLLVTLEETNKYKDQLLASVSHELRAPLNGNINLIEGALNSSKVPELIKESFLIPALRSGKFLLHIINDILDMSQIKAKKLRLVFEAKNLQETLQNAAQLVELQAKKKQIKLILDINPNLPMTFCTDHMRLSQIVLNLLNNAIKFTKQGIVKMTAKCTQGNPDLIQIKVKDSGIGIHKENLKKIFLNYPNIEFEERQTLNPAGVGLGLNIVSNLVKLLSPKSHPEITVTSALNKGSIFSFIIENKDNTTPPKIGTLDEEISDPNSSSSFSLEKIADELPQDKSLPKASKQNSEANSLTSLIMPTTKATEMETLVDLECSCPKILTVDDNPFNTMAFETILNSLDIKCDSVYSGSACLQKLLDRQNKTCGKSCRPYSVVFMDQEIPEMTGSETVVEVRKLQGESLVPEMKIIGCTAHKAKEEVDKFMESGLDSCIFKPISVVMIRDVLKEILVSDE